MGNKNNVMLSHLNFKLSVLFTLPISYQAYSLNTGTEVHKTCISHYTFTNFWQFSTYTFLSKTYTFTETAIQRNQLHTISLICDKSVITQNLAFLSYGYRKKCLQMHF